jgi:hypothetical protein
MPDFLLIKDSTKSPIIPKKEIRSPMNIEVTMGMSSKRNSNISTLAIIEQTMPPIEPS